MKKKTRCYIYTRVSTAIQVDGYSLDAQKDKLRKYAEFQDMEIVGEYSDEGHSGKNIKGRHEFMRMMDDIEESKDGVDFVIVFKLSRFGRNAADVISSLQLIQDYGVNLICVEDGSFKVYSLCYFPSMLMAFFNISRASYASRNSFFVGASVLTYSYLAK